MRVLQVATTYGRACGVGNFARSLAGALGAAGIEVRNARSAKEIDDADLTLVHHEWGLFPSDDELRAVCTACPQPVVLFAHSDGVERFADVARGFMAMSLDVVGDAGRPVLAFPHPAWTPQTLTDRNLLRSRFGLPVDRCIVATSGLLRRDHEFPEILERLLPHAVERDWLVWLVTSEWDQGSASIVERLDRLAQHFPRHLRFGTRFLSDRALNQRLQACDLLWCWSRSWSLPYGSGTASDQYASGTRVVVPATPQYWHVVTLPNVLPGPTDLDAFVRLVAAEAPGAGALRHDPSPVAWERSTVEIVEFLTLVRDQAP